MLCHVCSTLEYEDLAPGWIQSEDPWLTSDTITFSTTYHGSLKDVRRSADQGCEYCNTVFARLKRDQYANSVLCPDDTKIRLGLSMSKGWSKEKGHFLREKNNDPWQSGPGFSVRYSKPREGLPSLEVSSVINVQYIETDTSSLLTSAPIPNVERDSHTGSAVSLVRAKAWLEECLNHHEFCPVAQDIKLPTRVIDVGTPHCDPFLLLTDGKKGQFVTLSHCWGEAKITTTTSSNLSQRLESIPMASLPRTFQDAVIATRAMGQQFPRIDSLCILQDSMEDWAIASSRMGDYFSKCLYTIAASDASDATQGCFRMRDPSRINTSQIRRTCRQASASNLYSIRPIIRREINRSRSHYHYNCVLVRGQVGTNALHGSSLESRKSKEQGSIGGVAHMIYMCAFTIAEGVLMINIVKEFNHEYLIPLGIVQF